MAQTLQDKAAHTQKGIIVSLGKGQICNLNCPKFITILSQTNLGKHTYIFNSSQRMFIHNTNRANAQLMKQWGENECK